MSAGCCTGAPSFDGLAGEPRLRGFTVLQEEGVEPANNIVERIFRTAVQWRKISFGNRSRNGEIATAPLLTVAQTCKRQRRHV